MSFFVIWIRLCMSSSDAARHPLILLRYLFFKIIFKYTILYWIWKKEVFIINVAPTIFIGNYLQVITKCVGIYFLFEVQNCFVKIVLQIPILFDPNWLTSPEIWLTPCFNPSIGTVIETSPNIGLFHFGFSVVSVYVVFVSGRFGYAAKWN